MSASLLTLVLTANPPISLAILAAPSVSRSATTTPRAPSAAKRRQSARPMPLAPPVTTTTLSWIFIFAVSPAGDRRAAINYNRLSGYPIARTRREQHCHARNLFRLTDAAQRIRGFSAGQNLRVLPQSTREICAHQSRRDAVGA